MGACTPCPAGEYASHTGSVACAPCPSGSVANNGAGTRSVSCSLCSAGSASNDGQACTPCPTGCVRVSTCSPLPPGCIAVVLLFVLCAHLRACVAPCGRYFAPAAGAPNCTICPSGSTNTGTSNTDCESCPQGFHRSVTDVANHVTVCSLCDLGKISNAGACRPPECVVACSYALTSVPPTGSEECHACVMGTFAEADRVTCTTCPANTYRLSAAQGSTCDGLCTQGKYSDAGAVSVSDCENCVAGFYGVGDGQGCAECPAGKYSSAGATSCTGARSPASCWRRCCTFALPLTPCWPFVTQR